MKRIQILLAVVVLCAAFQPGLQSQQKNKPRNRPGSDRAALLKTDASFSKLSVKKGIVEAFLAYMAKDAILLPAGSNPVTGRENVRRHLSDSQTDGVLSWKPVKAEVSGSADLGYTYGIYELKFVGEGGNTKIRNGKYVTVWRKQKNGSWKFIIDIGNQNPPLTED